MKNRFFALLTVLMICAVLNAQVASDPTDEFYENAQGWEIKGYVDQLPLLRPYPLNVIKQILEQVMTNAPAKDANLAQEEYKRIFGDKAYHLFVEGGATVKLSQKHVERSGDKETSKTKSLTGEAGIAGDVVLHPLVGVSYKLGFWGTSADYDDYSPYRVNQSQDSVFDPTSVGPIDIYTDWNTNVSFGTAKVYASAGVNRVGYGPFLNDGLALNDSSFHSVNFMFNVLMNRWSFASVYETIGATSNDGRKNGDWLGNGKYLSFHALKYRATPKFDISYYENVVFGKGTDLSFLIPAPYMAIQNIGGASANLQMGLLMQYRPVETLEWASDVSIDDISLNDLVKLNFDTKLRFALTTGLIYSPKESRFNMMSIYYTAALPYYGAHWQYDDANESGYMSPEYFNYQNLTNAGVNIGTNLEPNSDRIAFRTKINISKNFKLAVNTNFIRHANSAEALSERDILRYMLCEPGTHRTDGSVYMHQMFSAENHETDSTNHVKQAWNHLGFMTSDHIMKAYQAGFAGEFIVPNRKNSKGQLSVNIGYTFEYINNYNVNQNIYDGVIDVSKYGYASDGTLNAWESSEKDVNGNAVASGNDETSLTAYCLQKADEQYNTWLSNLYDRVNHYVTLSFKYSF